MVGHRSAEWGTMMLGSSISSRAVRVLAGLSAPPSGSVRRYEAGNDTLLLSSPLLFSGKTRPPLQAKKAEPMTDRLEFYQGKLPNCQFLAGVLMALQEDL